MFNFRSASGGILLALSLVLTACGQKAPTKPAPDAQALSTAAAQTIEAGLTQTAEIQPTSTGTPEPLPTETGSIPTLAEINASGNPTVQPGSSLPTASGDGATTPIVFPSLTPVATSSSGSLQPGTTAPDKSLWVANKPADNSKLDPGQTVKLTFTVKNAGQTTWTTKYELRLFAGNGTVDPKNSSFPKSVAPGESVDLIVSITAPKANGSYQLWWKLTNADGKNFGDLNFDYHVGTAASSSPTPKK